MMELAGRFEAAQSGDSTLQNAELTEILRIVPGKRAVVAGHFEGREAVFRFSLDPDDAMPAREWAELQRVWPYMREGASRIAEPFHFNERHSVLVMEKVPGTPLLKHFWNSPKGSRRRHLAPAADWLRCYTRPTEAMHPVNARRWLKRTARAAAQQPFRKLAVIEGGILQQLRPIADALEGRQWRCAVSHGDFHPNNLILGQDRLTGIDIGGSAVMPLYKDMARFLVHMGRRGVIPSGNGYLGVDREGINEFARAFEMTEQETETALPFMIGCEALLRVETKGLKRGRIRRAEEMYTLLLEDLRDVARS